MIIAEDISVSFKKGFRKGRIKALDGFTVSIHEGDIFALLGPNGAGKSTAMYCFLGLIQPDSGAISIFGRKPVPGSSMFYKTAYLPEEPNYHLYLTVHEVIHYYASLYGGKVAGSKVMEAIERVGLLESKDVKLSKCSKGMKQKVGIAQCLLNNPKILFLDEPTRGLDPVMTKSFRDILVEMNKGGATIIINSHVLSEVEAICNRAAIINRGKVIVHDELNRLIKTNFESYRVEFDYISDLPEYVKVEIEANNNIKGEIPFHKLMEFIIFTNENKLRVYECTLRKHSLEDTFFNILGKDGGC